MLSKEDYRRYLDQIIEIEDKMSAIYSDCSERLGEGSVKDICNSLSIAEKKHSLLVEELRKLFDF